MLKHIGGVSLKRRVSRHPEHNTVRRPEFAILRLLVGLASSFNLHYCFPSQRKILELLWTRCHVRMSRRTLCRHLKSLELAGYLSRTRRHRRDKHLGFVMCSTLYRVLSRAFAETLTFVGHLQKIAKRISSFHAGTRVPRAAQYARNFIKVLMPQPSYPQAGAPGTP